jgi:hypothetical protein
MKLAMRWLCQTARRTAIGTTNLNTNTNIASYMISTFVYGAEATIAELSAVIKTIRRFLKLLIAEDVRLQVLDAARLRVAAPGIRCPAGTAVLEQLRG